jgi:hypothetical protein
MYLTAIITFIYTLAISKVSPNCTNNNEDTSFNDLQGNSDEEASKNDLVWCSNTRYNVSPTYLYKKTSYLDNQKYMPFCVYIEPLNHASIIKLFLEGGGLKPYVSDSMLIEDTLDPL